MVRGLVARFGRNLRAAFAQAVGAGGRCLACSCRLSGDSAPAALCGPCAAALAPLTHGYCPACGLIHCLGESPRLCGACRQTPPPWDALHFLRGYDGLLEELIGGFKFRDQLRHQRLLTDLAATALGFREQSQAQVAVPVPLHPRRLGKRGFNQSLELARRLPGVTLAPKALARVRATRPQVGLSREERLTNLQGAFCASAETVAGRGVLLVDDVMTTGGTVRECVSALRAAGAARVEVLVLARA